MLSLLQEKLEAAFKKLRGHGKISESNVTDAMREIRMGLLEADVDFKVAKDLCEAVKTEGRSARRSCAPSRPASRS